MNFSRLQQNRQYVLVDIANRYTPLYVYYIGINILTKLVVLLAIIGLLPSFIIPIYITIALLNIIFTFLPHLIKTIDATGLSLLNKKLANSVIFYIEYPFNFIRFTNYVVSIGSSFILILCTYFYGYCMYSYFLCINMFIMWLFRHIGSRIAHKYIGELTDNDFVQFLNLNGIEVIHTEVQC